jgi:hypothetical protein
MYQEERSSLLRNYKENPILISHLSNYEISFNEDQLINAILFYDASSEKRFFPDWERKKKLALEKTTDFAPYKSNIEYVKELLKNELISLDLYDIYQSKLESLETEKMAGLCFAQGADIYQVFGMIIQEFLISIPQ